MLILRTLLIWSAVYFSNPFNIPRLWYLVGTRSILVGWAFLPYLEELDLGGTFTGECAALIFFVFGCAFIRELE